MSYKKLCQIALTKLDQIGPVMARSLVSYCGGVEAIFESSFKSLCGIPGIGEKAARKISQAKPEALALEEYQFLEDNEITMLFFLDKEYPSRLKPYDDTPIVLYYKGSSTLNHFRTVAIVGTRKPTPLGKSNCEKLVEELHAFDVQIISGLAYGIDIIAHRKSIDLGIPTIGVLGHGLDRIYPGQHKKTARAMIEHGGLLTEFGIHSLPDREHFPMRNRIIAALSDVIVVVESRRSGGSIITAEFANAYNKDVFAFPGRLSDSSSAGCNRLIKTHQAYLIESASDIAYLQRWEELDAKKEVQTRLFIELNHTEKQLVDLLRQKDSVGIDIINSYMALGNSELAAILLQLEFKGAIKALPGKRYMAV